MTTAKLEIAVIGGGAAGLTAAHLLQRRHKVTLFEKNGYVGGHTRTVVLEEGPDAGTPVDTGFIVLNDKNYPTLHRLLAELGVAVRWSDMSFGYHCEATGLQYAGTDLGGLFAQRGNLLRPAFLRMLADIVRFCGGARRDLRRGGLAGKTLGSYLAERGFNGRFLRDYLLPMGAAIWSAPDEAMLDFPAESFARFFENHGLLSLRDRPRWQTVAGGSHAYVKAFLSKFSGEARPGCAVKGVRADGEGGVLVRLPDGSRRRFDRAVLAAHADEALGLLEDPTPEERRLLGAWRYQRNRAVLHTDRGVLPPNRRAWASWNYLREQGGGGAQPVSVTYHMNRLQGLRASREYCVTLNRRKPIRENDIIRDIEFTHPVYDMAAVATQRELPGLNGRRGLYFCGSYFGYGFHEDAVKSGAAVAALFGLSL